MTAFLCLPMTISRSHGLVQERKITMGCITVNNVCKKSRKKFSLLLTWSKKYHLGTWTKTHRHTNESMSGEEILH